MTRVLVLGEPRWRRRLAEQLEAAVTGEVAECDPALGDCVMYVRLEGVRYDAFVYAGFDHPVTRGALATVAERAVLFPLLGDDAAPPDASHDGYLFRLPQALAFRDEAERGRVLAAVPKASTLPSVVIGSETLDPQALVALVDHATAGTWQWRAFVDGVRRDVGRAR